MCWGKKMMYEIPEGKTHKTIKEEGICVTDIKTDVFV